MLFAQVGRDVTEVRIGYVGCGLSGRRESMDFVRRRLGGPTRSCLHPNTFGYTHHDEPVISRVDVAVEHGGLRLVVDGETNAYYDHGARLAVISAAHALVLVIDSQQERFEANLEVIEALEPLVVDRPVVVQFNKRDLPNALPLAALRAFDRFDCGTFAAVATRGDGVWEAFEAAAALAARRRRCEPELRALLAAARP